MFLLRDMYGVPQNDDAGLQILRKLLIIYPSMINSKLYVNVSNLHAKNECKQIKINKLLKPQHNLEVTNKVKAK